ncbi:MAG: PEP-CTERM sorting domain-containing protein [Bryocella sp.]
MNLKLVVSLAVLSLCSALPRAFADTVTITGNPGALTSNFGNPGSDATVGYTISTNDTGGAFNITLQTADPNALPFANLYFDTIASTPNTGSNLGFEFALNSMAAFDPDTSTKFNLTGTGVTSSIVTDTDGTLAIVSIPNSFFLNNPLGMPFTPTTPGDLVSLHLSQSFSYSVVGGSGNFAAPTELGAATVGTGLAVTPEPSSALLLATGLFGILAISKKKKLFV